MTRKRTYLNLLRCMGTDELARSAASPSAYMSGMHVALHHLELRRRGRISSYWEVAA